MNTKETLFFIGKCLTLGTSDVHRKEIADRISNGDVNWDQFVQISTAHYVFPALYINLRKAEFLKNMPEDLVNFMREITELNRNRNLEIIEQAQEINSLLRENEIVPIFLKGTGFLLQNFYSDPAERMVGDIDFLLAKDQIQKALSLLKEKGYTEVFPAHYNSPSPKHLPRIHKVDKVAAVEIHFSMTVDKYAKEFNYHTVIDQSIEKDGVNFLALKDQLALSLIAKQINDNGMNLYTMSLRNGYDVLLLSNYVDPLLSIQRFDSLFRPLNNFLALCNFIFKIDSIRYQKNAETHNSLQFFHRIHEDKKFGLKHLKRVKSKASIQKKLRFMRWSLYKKDYFLWMVRKLTSPQWYKDKLG